MGRNIVTLCLVGVALAAILFGAFSWRSVHEREREAIAAKGEADTLREALAVADRMAELEKQRDAAVPVAGAPGGKGGSGVTDIGAAEPEGGSNPMAGMIAGMRDNPEMKEMLAGQQKIMVDQLYGPLLENLDLTAEEEDTLRAILVERQISFMDQGLQLMDGAKSKEEKEALAVGLGEQQKEWEGKIKALIGGENFEKMDLYEKSQPERQQIKTFKESLAGSDYELALEQEEALMSAMYEERKNFKYTNAMGMGKQEDGGASAVANMTAEKVDLYLEENKILQEKTLNRAAEILSPEQLESFRKSQESYRSMQEFGMKMGVQMIQGGEKEE